jgi:energy-coupling factor transport system permease protein
MTYRRRASPLHAARAAAALAWVAALAVSILVESNPLVLAALAATIVCAAAAAKVLRAMVPALWMASLLAVTVCLINALVTRDGLTVIWRFGDLPVLGQTNVTFEATVYGAILGLRAAALLLLGALYSLAVDPDEVLRLFRRLSFRSALSATIATRMVPVLIRDGRRLADAQRCRPGPPPGRLQLLRATTSGVLDRALDVAATLELRGFSSTGGNPGRGASVRPGRPWSRHDIAFALSASLVLLVAIGSRIADAAPFQAYPVLRAPAGARVLTVAGALVVCALAPFVDRRGVDR